MISFVAALELRSNERHHHTSQGCHGPSVVELTLQDAIDAPRTRITPSDLKLLILVLNIMYSPEAPMTVPCACTFGKLYTTTESAVTLLACVVKTRYCTRHTLCSIKTIIIVAIPIDSPTHRVSYCT